MDNLPIEGAKIFDVDAYHDERGAIFTTFDENILRSCGVEFKRDKFNTNKRRVLRGIHWDDDTTKLVTCVYGDIEQVIVDMRPHSKTFMNHLKFNIGCRNRKAILIPPGVGNGFCVLSAVAIYHYKLAYPEAYIDAPLQRTIAWNSPDLGIEWQCDAPILSNRDNLTLGAKID